MSIKQFHGNALVKHYLALDLETTCLDETKGSVVEVYATFLEMKDGHLVQSALNGCKYDLHAFFLAEEEGHYEQEGMRVNGLTKDGLIKHGAVRTLQDAENSDSLCLLSMLEQCLVGLVTPCALMAHYAPFELKWLDHHLFQRYHGKSILECIPYVYDTRDVETTLYPDVKHSLAPVLERRGIEVAGHHRSIDDVRGMVQVADLQMQEIEQADLSVTSEWKYDITQHLERK